MEKRKYGKNYIIEYTAIFVIVFTIIFLPFIKGGISTIWKIDGVAQYYPSFLYIGQYLRNFILTGNLPKFDLQIGMGEDVISVLNYYGFGDPLNILAIFANKTNGAYVYAFMFFLRLYLAGLSFLAYVKYMKLDDKLIVAGTFMYLCTGYTFVACLMYSEYSSILIYLPLLLFAVEKQFKEQQWWWMVIVSLYAILCTIYLFYYAVLFLLPYCLVRSFFVFDSNIKKMIKECVVCGLLSIVGALLSLPILIPTLKGIFNSSRPTNSVLSVLTALTNYRPRRYNIIQFIKGFIPTYGEGIFFFHEIPVFSYLSILLLFVVFFVYKRKTRINKQLLIGISVGCILFTIPISNIVFSGFMDGFSYDRWIFILEFMFAICFICVSSELIKEKFSSSLMAYRIVYVLVLINVVAVGLLLYEKTGREFTNEFIPFKEAYKYVDSPVNYSRIIQNDKELYRISNDSLTNVNERPENVQMLNDYNGLTFWFSVINPNAQEIADRQKKIVEEQGLYMHRMFGLENKRVSESLAGVKYYLRHDNEDFPKEYIFKENVEFNGEKWEVYENPDVLPLCYGFEKTFYENKLEELYYSYSEELLKRAVKAESVIYDEDKIICEINMPYEGVVLLAIPYTEGFSVTIDNTPSKIYNSTICYLAVYVPKGSHRLEFSYSPYR